MFIAIIGFINCVKIKMGDTTDHGRFVNQEGQQKLAFPFTVGGKQYFYAMSKAPRNISANHDEYYWSIRKLQGGMEKREQRRVMVSGNSLIQWHLHTGFVVDNFFML